MVQPQVLTYMLFQVRYGLFISVLVYDFIRLSGEVNPYHSIKEHVHYIESIFTRTVLSSRDSVCWLTALVSLAACPFEKK